MNTKFFHHNVYTFKQYTCK